MYLEYEHNISSVSRPPKIESPEPTVVPKETREIEIYQKAKKENTGTGFPHILFTKITCFLFYYIVDFGRDKGTFLAGDDIIQR